MLLLVTRFWFFFILASLYAGLSNQLYSQGKEDEIPPCPVHFLMDAMLSTQGDIWVVAEEGGVWKFDLSSQQWQDMSQMQGFPPTTNCYAIAEDKQQRIWVGTDNQGVIVWNSKQWQQYSPVEGPIGERIFDIAINPNTGSVAMATSAGLSLYHPKTDAWQDITRAEGLLEDQIESLSYSPQGKLLLGYACGGISISTQNNQYSQWTHTQTKWFWDKKQYIRQPLSYTGEGIPSNLCNVVLALAENKFWVGTNSGLAKSSNSRNWIFLRGTDAPAKNEGLYQGIPAGTNKASPAVPLLPEDFVTALLPCPEGIWVGFREQGACLIDPDTMQIKEQSELLNKQSNPRSKWVRTFLHLPCGQILAATYGGGLQPVGRSQVYLRAPVPHSFPKHPRPVAAPTDEEISQRIKTMAAPASQPLPAAFLYEDWATQGDWCQRYGRRYAVLCAANTPMGDFNFSLNANSINKKLSYQVLGRMGPHRQKDDSLRHWIHWINVPENRKVLYNPFFAIRTEAEWDDQGEAYSRTFDGPDVWAIVNVPTGMQSISLYFFNPNGREHANGYRDYILELRKVSANIPEEKIEATIKDIISLPVCARTRVNHFAGAGVYKTFVVQGGSTYYIRVCRNYSMNTILNGVFLSAWKELEAFYYNGGHPYSLIAPNPPSLDDCDMSSYSIPALQLWGKTMQQNILSRHPLFLLRTNKLLAYRKNMHHIKDSQDILLKHWRWQLRLWTTEDRVEFKNTMEQDWERKQDEQVMFRAKGLCRYSPNVVPFSEEELCMMHYHKINWKDFLPGAKKSTPEDILLMKKQLTELKKISTK